jgi:uncharacterized protein YjbI with pentapeptide repeats
MEKRKAIPGFKDSEISPRTSNMDLELIRSMAEASEELLQETIKTMISAHKEFISTGGNSGGFERLEAAGMPMNIFMGSASRGEQFLANMKKIGKFSDLSGADLTLSDFSGSLSEEVDFSKAVLNKSMFTDGFFMSSNFEGATCHGTDFTNSDLRYANFRNADLRNADFEIANCEFADFTGAILDGASFKGANLENVKR